MKDKLGIRSGWILLITAIVMTAGYQTSSFFHSLSLVVLVAMLSFSVLFRMQGEEQQEWREKYDALEARLNYLELSSMNRPGFVYLMQRQDGICKIGYTDDLDKRRRAHERDYGMAFLILSSWLVPDKARFEWMALKLTSGLKYPEGGRGELRQMTGDDLTQFVATFDGVVETGRGESEKRLD